MIHGYVEEVGIVYACPQCNSYSAYLPYRDSKLMKPYMPDDCPRCGMKLAAYPTE